MIYVMLQILKKIPDLKRSIEFGRIIQIFLHWHSIPGTYNAIKYDPL
jgi:hypothetical protein